MTDLNKKIPYIDGIKTVSLILIIFCHCTFFYDDNPFFTQRSSIVSPPLSFTVRLLDAMLVQSYVFCSGFLYGRSLMKHNRTIFGWIKERAKRLLGNYYIYGIIWLVPLYTLFDIDSFGRPEHAGLLEGYKCMILGLFSDHLWFLWMLFWVSVFFIFMAPFIKKNRLETVFLLTAALAVVVDLYLQWFPYFKISQISPYLFCYLLGIVCFRWGDRMEGWSRGTHLAIAGVCLAVLTVYVIQRPEHFAIRYIAAPVGAAFEYFLFRALYMTGKWTDFNDTALYKYFLKHRMDFYLLHMPMPYLFFKWLDPYVGMYPALCVAINFILSMTAVAAIVQIKSLILRNRG